MPLSLPLATPAQWCALDRSAGRPGAAASPAASPAPERSSTLRASKPPRPLFKKLRIDFLPARRRGPKNFRASASCQKSAPRSLCISGLENFEPGFPAWIDRSAERQNYVPGVGHTVLVFGLCHSSICHTSISALILKIRHSCHTPPSYGGEEECGTLFLGCCHSCCHTSNRTVALWQNRSIKHPTGQHVRPDNLEEHSRHALRVLLDHLFQST